MVYIGSGMAEVDKTIATINMVCNTMVGDGSTATMEIGTTQAVPGSVNNVSIYYDGVMQRPTTDYTLSYKTVTFTTAPENLVNVVCLSYANAFPSTVSDSTVYGSGIEDNAITDAKIASLISSSKLTGALPAIDGSALTGVSAEEITKSSSDPTISINPAGGVGTVWANTATGEMYICIDATTNANVWTNVGDGTGNVPLPSYFVATGGTITTDGNFKIHIFNSSGTFTVAQAGTGGSLEYLMVASGGGGGYSGNCGGGGGAGGYLTGTATGVGTGSHSITIGAGGAGRNSDSDGGDGTNAVFNYGTTITSIGGGGGGFNTNNGHTGGSGGGGGGGGNTTGGAATAGQGFAGGVGVSVLTLSGGGGGAGGVAETPSANNPSDGGVGLSSNITGSAIFRAGGGGGAWYGAAGAFTAPGGNGGGGSGGSGNSIDGVAGTTNTGGGGGGGGRTPGVGNSNGGNGGSGVVIIKYQFQ